jgi:NADPH:quinone reductase-like Zn-dependent oxidoreductase
VLERQELPAPEPGPMEVRVRVEALGLNHLDVWVRNGVEGHKFPLPLTPGCDVSGVIEKFGAGSESALFPNQLKLGSPVLVSPGVSCGICPACLSGFDPLCPRYGILGEHRDGGAADLVVVPVANLIARPEDLSAVEAAALPIGFLTAWSMLTAKARLRAGETVLIHAGGSAVGVAAIQMAKLLGAHVITTVGSDDKVDKARALGADHVIQYRSTPFREEVKRILAVHGKKGCEVVVDHVGADTFSESFKCLSWGGRLVTCGATSGSRVELDLKPLFFKNISILGSTMGSKAELLRIVDLVAGGQLRPVVDSVEPMKDYPAALERLGRRQVFGKIVVVN